MDFLGLPYTNRVVLNVMPNPLKLAIATNLTIVCSLQARAPAPNPDREECPMALRATKGGEERLSPAPNPDCEERTPSTEPASPAKLL